MTNLVKEIEALKEEIEVNRIYHAEDVAEFIDKAEAIMRTLYTNEMNKLLKKLYKLMKGVEK